MPRDPSVRDGRLDRASGFGIVMAIAKAAVPKQRTQFDEGLRNCSGVEMREPETTVTLQPSPGSRRARARSTCALPPRGKNSEAETTRRDMTRHRMYPGYLGRKTSTVETGRPPASTTP